jgi:mannose-6-phosphate isomerase class I
MLPRFRLSTTLSEWIDRMYDKAPFVGVSNTSQDCRIGWTDISATIRNRCPDGTGVICVECYPGVLLDSLCIGLGTELSPCRIVRAEECYLAEPELERKVHPLLTDDPVFGRMNDFDIADFLDMEKVSRKMREIGDAHGEMILIVGTGATLIAPRWDMLIYADLARWEIQQRQRRGIIGNLGIDNLNQSPSLKYKRGFFLDWRAADRRKHTLLPKIDFLLDTNKSETPKLITGLSLRAGLDAAVRRPFRVVPFFDPGPWGGHWMEEVCDLPRDVPNYAWCFDCVPEENSLLLGFGDQRVEIPALDLVLMRPRALLGEAIESRFGAEFPIRFDFLDTMGGGNLSLQVHPRLQYIREAFGMTYTQDESYYLLDAQEDACVYLGLREEADADSMLNELIAAELSGSQDFNAELYVNKFPARKHDHFLIPAGTVHCSGRNSMVLEISATPFIFTFKLWDWGRPGLDGKPRPIHLNHGAPNICWDRRTEWVKRSLINRVDVIASGEGWREERTGLHEMEFIETRRHWFSSTVPHDTNGTVNVLNLVEGEQAIVESPTGAFEPFEVHYAETFIIAAAVGPYTIRPLISGQARRTECATIKAFVRRT